MSRTGPATETDRMLSREDDERRERLQQARRAAGYTNAKQAAEALKNEGLVESTYRSHENGGRRLTENTGHIYARAFGISYEWLWTGKGEMERPASDRPISNVAPGLSVVVPSSRLIPVMGRARAGDGGVIVLDGTINDQIEAPGNLSKVENAYAVEVVGDCMIPRYEPGELVLIHPTRPVHSGSYVLLQIRDRQGELVGLIKKFVRATQGQVVVAQLNPPQELTFDKEDVIAMHRILGSQER